MTKSEKIDKCKEYFSKLSDSLTDSYESVGSCNNDLSQYLIPKGTLSELTYYSKPKYSFRISDHWNWYSSLKKCRDERYIQCHTKDLPKPRRRTDEGKASKPVIGICVCFFGSDGLYHVLFGETFNRKTKKWEWVESDPSAVASMISSLPVN